MLPEAEIIFVPYNYLIDPMARRSIGISIENSILIFDEAHNVVGIHVRGLHIIPGLLLICKNGDLDRNR